MESDLFDSYYIEKIHNGSFDSTSNKNLLLKNNPALIFRFYNELYKYKWISFANKDENTYLKEYAAALSSIKLKAIS
jgi:hypothetical protein